MSTLMMMMMIIMKTTAIIAMGKKGDGEEKAGEREGADNARAEDWLGRRRQLANMYDIHMY